MAYNEKEEAIRKSALEGAVEASKKQMEAEEAKAIEAAARSAENHKKMRADIEVRKQEMLNTFGAKDKKDD